MLLTRFRADALAAVAPRLQDFSRASFSNACLELLLQVLHELGHAEVYPTGKKEQDKPKAEKPKEAPFVVSAEFRQRLIEVEYLLSYFTSADSTL